MTRSTYIIGGGTFSHVRAHMAIAAPAFGETARQIFQLYVDRSYANYQNERTFLELTKMADHTSSLVTNEDVDALVTNIIADKTAKLVFFNAAMCDFTGQIGLEQSGKYATRLKTNEGLATMVLTPAPKLIKRIREHRKDIFVVAFKTTCGASQDEQYRVGLNLLKANSVNLVLANDLETRTNMIIVPEEARYCVTKDRQQALSTLVAMADARSRLHFTRSTVVEGDSVDWNGPEIPNALRKVVNHCVRQGAYKPFRGATAGHFAYKVDDHTFITSKRKTDFNQLDTVGMVRVFSKDKDSVIAVGAKPSVGGQSQRIIFSEHEGVDCIVHFHSPMRPGAKISVRPQQWVECGSHECGQNTSDGLQWTSEEGIKAVYLDEHGPNIVFNQSIDPDRVIAFIDRNFDLSAKTGGLVA